MRYYGLMMIVAVAALVGAVSAKLHSRWKANCANVPCTHLAIRLSVFEQRIAARRKSPTYLVIGDSITEIGPWRTLCGLEPFDAGISAARSDTWLPYAKTIANALKPDLIVLALGTNDLLTLDRLGPYEELVDTLSQYRLVAVPVHMMPQLSRKLVDDANKRIAKAVSRTAEPIVAETTDGIHLAAKDHVLWFEAIKKVVCSGD